MVGLLKLAQHQPTKHVRITCSLEPLMIDFQQEQLIRLCDVPRLNILPPRRAGTRLAVSTLYRWALHGQRGIKLETIKCGGIRCTSLLALQRFFAAITMERDHKSAPSKSNHKLTSKRRDGVEAELDRLGIK